MGKTAKIMEWNNEYEKYSEEQRKLIEHLPMKPGEILAKFKRAAGSGAETMNLLADLNGCDRKTIGMILEMELSVEQSSRVKKEKEKKVEQKTTRKTTTKAKREKVPALIWNVIEREYKECNERIDSLKRELNCAEKALVSFADFLDKHEAE
ncbi:hypothetical protein [Eubacterium sp.]|uniref:hypothetical protein n=1 Tax=Eubacterium TaxID=1730 RepID=UPI0039948AEB